MIEFAQRDSHLAGKIDQRDGESAQRNQEKDGHPALMLELKERGYKCHDNRSVTEMLATTAQKMARFSIAARRIRRGRSALSRHLTSSSGYPVQDNRSVNDTVQTGNQDRDESRQRAQQERGRRRLRDHLR